MKTTELKREELELHIKVAIPSKDINDAIEHKLQDLSKKIKKPGFRVGKVPIEIIRREYAGSVRVDVLEDQINKSSTEIIKRDNLNISSTPKIVDVNDKEDEDFIFTLQFELMPNFDMPNFAKLSIQKPVVTIQDKDILEELNKIQEANKSYDEVKNDTAQLGDMVVINAVGFVDGEAFEGGKLDSYKLVLGSGVFIPGFEDQLVGVKAGDKKNVEVKFPESYHVKKLAGKDSKFEVEALTVHAPMIPAIDDELAKKLHIESLDKLKSSIREDLEKYHNENTNYLMKMLFFSELEDLLKFPVPASLLNRELDFLKSEAARSGDDDFEKNKEKYTRISLRRIRIGIMLAKYAKDKNLNVTNEDIRIAVMKQMQRDPRMAKQILDFYTKNASAIEHLKGTVLEEKAVDYIFANEMKFESKEYTVKDFMKALEEITEKELLKS